MPGHLPSNLESWVSTLAPCPPREVKFTANIPRVSVDYLLPRKPLRTHWAGLPEVLRRATIFSALGFQTVAEGRGFDSGFPFKHCSLLK